MDPSHPDRPVKLLDIYAIKVQTSLATKLPKAILSYIDFLSGQNDRQVNCTKKKSPRIMVLYIIKFIMVMDCMIIAWGPLFCFLENNFTQVDTNSRWVL